MSKRGKNRLGALFLMLCSCALFMSASSGKKFDVIVVGSGAAGLSASIEAASAGAKVAVVEKLPMVGGSTVLSGGIVYATESKAMKDMGIQDTVDDLVNYWNEKAEGAADMAQLRFVAERSGPVVDWLVGLGVKFEKPGPRGTSPVPRGHTCAEGGIGIIRPLKAEAEKKGVTFFLETKVTELVKDKKGAVIGVKAQGKDGKKITLRAKAVVLATGGFDRNQELMEKYAPQYTNEATYVCVGSMGDGLLMAQAAGAAIEGKGQVIGFRMVPGELAFTSDVSYLVWYTYLAVNQEGKRFVNEWADYPVYHQALYKQTGKASYSIYDSVNYRPALAKAVANKQAVKADTLAELATLVGIDPAALEATVNEYNSFVASGTDPQFGKYMKNLKPIGTPPFYALKVIAGHLGTETGIKIDLDTHAIDTKGNIIPGLYAAGEVANGSFFGRVYPASGTSIVMSLVFGKTAGQKAAEEAKK